MSTATAKQPEAPADDTAVSRSLRLDLFLSEDYAGLKRRIVSSIRGYRATARHCFSILACSQAAGATVQWKGQDLSVKPNNAKAKQILEAATGKEGKVLCYQMRDYILRDLNPTWMSFVFDSVRRDIDVAWKARDPEFPKASRGWLVLQGARGIAQFSRRGIGFPVATARPKLEKHSLILKWDHELGVVPFQMGRLDGGRYYIWKSLRDGTDGFELGTLYLSEQDGKIVATLTYQKPKDGRDVDEKRQALAMVYGNDPEKLVTLVGPDGEDTVDRIDSQEVRAFLNKMDTRKKILEARRAACGSPRRPWGHRRGWLAAQDVLSRLTALRENGVADRCHAISRRLVDRLSKWRCGVVKFEPLPETIAGFAWNFSKFRLFMEYKCDQAGISVIWSEPTKAGDGGADVE